MIGSGGTPKARYTNASTVGAQHARDTWALAARERLIETDTSDLAEDLQLDVPLAVLDGGCRGRRRESVLRDRRHTTDNRLLATSLFLQGLDAESEATLPTIAEAVEDGSNVVTVDFGKRK